MAELHESEPLRSDRFLELQANLAETFEEMVVRFGFQGLDAAEAIPVIADRLNAMIEGARGPSYDDDGYIAPVQTCSEAEFVQWFGTNAHRQTLLRRVQNWIRLARGVGAKRLLLDGSFITAKDEPGDVDGAILLPGNFREQLLAGNAQAIELLVAIFTREPKELLFADVEEDWWGWVEFFGRTREPSGRRKGLIEVVL